MFSGIVQEVGIIKDLRTKNGLLEIDIAYEKLSNIELGDSISVNGCCQTVVKTRTGETESRRNEEIKNQKISHSPILPFSSSFLIQATEETLDKTNFKTYNIGDKVNLEPSLKMGDKISGHLVSGHIDATGEVYDLIEDKDNTIVKIKYPKELSKFIAKKGSASVNGVSLTVIDSNIDGNCIFSFTLIPFTKSNTNLGLIKKGNLVNLEIDLISRYLINHLEHNEH